MDIDPNELNRSVSFLLFVNVILVIVVILVHFANKRLKSIETSRSKIEENFVVYRFTKFYTPILINSSIFFTIPLFSLLFIPIFYVVVGILDINATAFQVGIIEVVICTILYALFAPKIRHFYLKPEYLIYGYILIIRFVGFYLLIPLSVISQFHSDSSRKRISFEFRINSNRAKLSPLYFEFEQELEYQDMLEEIEKRLSVNIEKKELSKGRANRYYAFQPLKKIDVSKGAEPLPEEIIKIITPSY